MSSKQLHLASASPRRRDILEQLGIRFSYAGADIDETPRAGERPLAYVQRIALAKAVAVKQNVQADLPVLAADTVVVINDRIFGKPASKSAALEMLQALSGRRHEVLTALALCRGDSVWKAVSSTDVWFRDIDPDEARLYWQSGEAEGKAGAYAIQGLGGIFVEQIAGSYSGVVGLPVFETARLLRHAGIDVLTGST